MTGGHFRGLTGKNPVTAYPPQQVSRGVLHTGHGEVPPELFVMLQLGTWRRPSTREVGQLSATPCRSRRGARASPRALVSRRMNGIPLVPTSQDTRMIGLICPASILPGVPLDWTCQTSVTQSSLMLTNSAHAWAQNLHRSDLNVQHGSYEHKDTVFF